MVTIIRRLKVFETETTYPKIYALKYRVLLRKGQYVQTLDFSGFGKEINLLRIGGRRFSSISTITDFTVCSSYDKVYFAVGGLESGRPTVAVFSIKDNKDGISIEEEWSSHVAELIPYTVFCDRNLITIKLSGSTKTVDFFLLSESGELKHIGSLHYEGYYDLSAGAVASVGICGDEYIVADRNLNKVLVFRETKDGVELTHEDLGGRICGRGAISEYAYDVYYCAKYACDNLTELIPIEDIHYGRVPCIRSGEAKECFACGCFSQLVIGCKNTESGEVDVELFDRYPNGYTKSEIIGEWKPIKGICSSCSVSPFLLAIRCSNKIILAEKGGPSLIRKL